jgi:hypothetical protein
MEFTMSYDTRSQQRIKHWENLFQTKDTTQVFWHQKKPTYSLDQIDKQNLALDDAMIDVGSGTSFLCDELLKLGYTNLTLLIIHQEL